MFVNYNFNIFNILNTIYNSKPVNMHRKTFRLLVSATFAVAILVSCSKSKSEEQQSIVQKNIEDHVKPKLNDPGSYEFAYLKLIDSVDYQNNINETRSTYQTLLEYNERELEDLRKLKEQESYLYDETKEEKVQNSASKYKVVISKIDSIEKHMGDQLKETASYTYKYSFRGKNALGAVVLNEYLVQTSAGPDYKVVNVAEEEEDLLVSPNGFPGREEVVNELN